MDKVLVCYQNPSLVSRETIHSETLVPYPGHERSGIENAHVASVSRETFLYGGFVPYSGHDEIGIEIGHAAGVSRETSGLG